MVEIGIISIKFPFERGEWIGLRKSDKTEFIRCSPAIIMIGDLIIAPTAAAALKSALRIEVH